MTDYGMAETPINNPLTPETEYTVPLAFLLDVDGVITNPIEKRVTEPQIFDFIEKHLQQGNKVALNTGRSNEWMIERVITPLNERLKDKTILKNFFAVGEKGLTCVSFNPEGELTQGIFARDGKPVEGFDLSVFLEPETIGHFVKLNAETRKLIADKYSHSTFFDTSKKAMISTEMHDGYDQPKYAREQVGFTQELNGLLKREGLFDKFKVDPTTIATDIQMPEAGKHLGAKRILSWLKSQNASPAYYIAVGDSSSDLEMADELHSQGKAVDFYYVNSKKPLTVEKPYAIYTSKDQFGNGTIKIFRSIT